MEHLTPHHMIAGEVAIGRRGRMVAVDLTAIALSWIDMVAEAVVADCEGAGQIYPLFEQIIEHKRRLESCTGGEEGVQRHAEDLFNAAESIRLLLCGEDSVGLLLDPRQAMLTAAAIHASAQSIIQEN